MKTLTGLSLLLVVLLVSLSAYLRLSHSGIGCLDWPQCYGLIGQAVEPASSSANQESYQQIIESQSKPLAWATPLHRLVASVLGLLVLFLTFLSIRQKRYRLVSICLLLITAGLAVLGIRSGSLHDPAVVMGNLLGGFFMLALLGWLWFDMAKSKSALQPPGMLTMLAPLAILMLFLQITIGGFTSANFAATSCRTIPDCHGSWWPGPDLAKALNLDRTHEVTASGLAVGGGERIAIHKAHRIGAILSSLAILLASIMALRLPGTMRRTGFIVATLLILEFAVGVASVLKDLPIVLAVAHNWLAALLLLSLLKLSSLVKSSGQS